MKKLRGSLPLLIAAIIWGTAFVAQSKGAQIIGPFTYNALRMFIGAIVLVPVVFVARLIRKDKITDRAARREATISTIKGGICCGAVLFTASSLQQIAIKTTSVGKAGFITALYIVIVPIIKLVLFREKTSVKIWLYALLAIAGFYLLSISGSFSVAAGDLLTLVSACFFALHIITIDHFLGKNTDGILMSCVQFFTSGILAAAAMFIFEHPEIGSILDAKGAILYTGLMSSGVAYTLQIIGQRHTAPTVATLLMSLESVFAAISGWLILNQALSPKEILGCALVFAAAILAQIKA